MPAYLLDLAVRNVRCFGPVEQTLRPAAVVLVDEVDLHALRNAIFDKRSPDVQDRVAHERLGSSD